MTEPTAATPSRRDRAFALYPFLFAAYPVLFLWSQNLGETNAGDVLPILVLVLAVTALAMAVLTLVFRDARRAALIVAPIVVAILVYGHVANLVKPIHLRPLLQQAGWALLIVLGIVAAIRLRDAQVRRATWILDRMAAVLVIVALVIIVPFQANVALSARLSPSTATVPGIPDRPLRDVYYLVLDRYGSDWALKDRFGADNDLLPWLADHGFRVLHDSHANYVKTTLSMASTLNMTHLADLAARVGVESSDHAPVYDMLHDSLVARQFKSLGYDYLHLGSWYGPTRTDAGADRNLYVGGPSDFAATLYDTTAIPVALKRLKLAKERSSIEARGYANGVYEWQALASLRDAPGPKFVLAHILMPHPPYVFGEDGTYLGPASANERIEDRFPGQLKWTNTELRRFIEGVQSLPEDRRPIVILQADEGPYPPTYQRNTREFDWSTATVDELRTKYGILNAWYLPDGSDPGLTDTMTSVNTFPTLFSGYFGIQVPRLPDRIYTSANWNRPYDLTDVTDRITGDAP